MNKDNLSVIPAPIRGQAPAGIHSIIEQLKKRREFSLQADGQSMLPLLHPDDLVNYQRISFSKLKTNDLILVFKNNLAFTHRIIYKTDKYLITKGDNNLESDGKINPKQIIGKVVSVKRKNQIIDPEVLYLIQSSLYFKEIVKIVNVFKKNKLDYVFLKGLPVHLYYEKTHPRRIYQDADVLIHRGDYLKVKTILNSFGYKNNGLSPFLKNKKIIDSVEISFYKQANGFPIVFDVHLEAVFLMVQINNLDSLYPQELVAQFTSNLLITKKKIVINGQQFFILNTQYLILYLALHFFHHNFTGAFRLELLDKVIRKSHVSINQLIESAHKYSLENYIFPVFYLLNKYYQTPIYDFINFMNFKNFINLDIFNDQTRFEAGINRFKNIFILSPRPLSKRLLIFINFKVTYLILFTLYLKLKNLLINSLNNIRLNLWKPRTKFSK